MKIEPYTFTTACICRKGHIVSHDIRRKSSNFCPICHSETLTKCPTCGTPITGYDMLKGVVVNRNSYRKPLYCGYCGDAFPWLPLTLADVKNILREYDIDLPPEDINRIVECLTSILTDQPTAVSATIALGKIKSKLPEYVLKSITELLLRVGTEVMVRSIMG